MGRHKKRTLQQIKEIINKLKNYETHTENKQLSLKEAASMIEINDSRVRQLIIEGKIKAGQIGERTKFIFVSDLITYLEKIP